MGFLDVGCLREIKDNENRVGLTPHGVEKLVEAGHTVYVQEKAGKGSGFSDADYKAAGAKLLGNPREICEKARLILKVKEPLPSEYGYFNEDHLIFTYFHFAASRELTQGMINSKATCIAYETVEGPKGGLPLLAPMSEVAGKMAVQVGAYYLSKPTGGAGVLVSGVTNVPSAKVTVIGGGVVGSNAAWLASRMGAETTLLEINEDRIQQLMESLPDVSVVKSTPSSIAHAVRETDILVGAVLVAGAKAPTIVPKELVESMKAGSVIVDVAIDQGGCVETSRVTTHSNPVYKVGEVIHYCVGNMPGAFPRTSTLALTHATLPYALKLANNGLDACRKDPGLAKGVNLYKGYVTNQGVADAFGFKYTDPASQELEATTRQRLF